jgi:hypothetical protein
LQKLIDIQRVTSHRLHDLFPRIAIACREYDVIDAGEIISSAAASYAELFAVHPMTFQSTAFT